MKQEEERKERKRELKNSVSKKSNFKDERGKSRAFEVKNGFDRLELMAQGSPGSEEKRVSIHQEQNWGGGPRERERCRS